MQRHEKAARDDVLPHPVDLDSQGLAPSKKGTRASMGGRKLNQPKPLKKVNLENIKTNYRTNSPEYRFYEQWDKRGKYLSDQFDSKIQSKIKEVAEKQSGKNYYKMQMDDPTEKLKLQEERQRGKNPNDPQNKGMQRPQKNPESMKEPDPKLAPRKDAEDRPDLSQMPLYPLDVEKDVLDDFTTVLIGRRRSGKTWAQRWLLYHLRHRYPFGIVITGTRLNNFWSQYVPEEFIHDIEDISEVLDECMARQTYLEAQPDLGIDSRMFVILDDVMSDKYRIRFSTALSNLWTNGRHLKIGVFITLQDPKGIGPDLRENTDMCIIFRVYEGGRKKVIYEEWLSYFNALYCAPFFWKHTGLLNPETGERFEETRETTDQDRAKMIPQAIAILQAKNTDNLQGVFKKVVAEDPGPFVLGNPDYYKAGAFGNYKLIQGTDRRYRKMRESKPKNQKKSTKKKKDFSSDSSSSSG
jgi:hypothetical protein